MIPAQRQLNSHLSRLVVLHIHKLAYLSVCLFTHRSSEHALDPSTRPRTEKKDDEGEGWRFTGGLFPGCTVAGEIW